MARIPDEEIERLKREVDLATVVSRYGVELRKAGSDLVGRCPFHDDDTPSLVVTPAKGLWHCMGACHVGGSVIDWLMRTEGVSFRHAIEFLYAFEPDEMGRSGPPPVKATVRRLPSPLEQDAEDNRLLAQVIDYYQSSLQKTPQALDYLRRRKIDDTHALSWFRLGFSDRTLGLRLPEKNRQAGKEIRGRLERLGIYRSSGHEHFVGSLTIPVIGREGHIAEIYGRKIGSGLRAGTPLHLYLPGAHRGVWNPDALASHREVIITESLIDALSFYCAGFANVTASYGTAGFTEDHRKALKEHGTSRLLIAYDNDAAGNAAADKLAAELVAMGIECFRITCPHGADVNDVAVSADSPREALAKLVREASFMGAGPPPPGARKRPVRARDDMKDDDSSPGEPCLPSSAAVVQPPSSPLPSVPEPPAVAARHDELAIEIGEHLWRVRHIPAGTNPSSLRVNVMVRAGERFHIDVVDLYAARQRQAYATAAASELRADVDDLRQELGRVLLAVEEAQAAAAALADEATVPVMSAAERQAALALLSDPDLSERVTEAFSALGVVGEGDAALATWLVMTSRLAEKPLGAVIQSSSAAGKSTLAEAALSLFPAEHKVAYSAMTGQALYYLGESDLSHKVLAIAETEGAERASYALKLLVSEGRLSIASAGKDPVSGRLVTHTYEVAGPVALVMTTTAAELEPELANRLVVLAVDETRTQTRAVQDAQRRSETLDGLLGRVRREETITRFHNAQRLLMPYAVVNPHAPALSFSDVATRHRRDNAKLLGLIRAIALAHQHQRAKHTVEVAGRAVSYIEASEADVALASRLFEAILPVSTDEMAPATRRLLAVIGEHVADKAERSFTRRELREASGLGDSQLKVHLARLVDLEHLVANRAGPHTTYELVHAYGRYRPAGETNRPDGDGDRPVIGRFPDSSEKAATNRENGEDADLSAGSGRSGGTAEAQQLKRENTPKAPYRPVPGQLRVLGSEERRVLAVEGLP